MEFEELYNGYQRRKDWELWKVRLVAYPGWFQNSEKPPKIYEWISIPRLDGKPKTERFNKKELKELAKVIEQYK